MAFERIKFFRRIEADIDTDGTATLSISTDQPGDAIAVRGTPSTLAASTTRRTFDFYLPATTKGRYIKIELTCTSTFRLFGMRVLAKVMGDAGDWQWFAIPLRQTPDEWTEVQIPLVHTPDDWQTVPIPMRDTPDAFTEFKIPMRPTPEMSAWQEVPVEQ